MVKVTYPGQRPKIRSLSYSLSFYFLLRMRNAARTSAYVHYFHDMCKELGQYPANLILRLVNNTY